jgi:hypothetical protein
VNRSAWDILGVADDSDAKAIKRAYASALRATRPDENPEAFQALNDAYEYALAEARQRDFRVAQSAANEDVAPVEQSRDGDSALAQADPGNLPVLGRALDEERPPAQQSSRGFDFEPFFAELRQKLMQPNPLHLREWLDGHPELYSLELKWALIPHVFDAIARNAPEINPHRGHLDTLQAFFGVDARIRRHPAIAPAIDYLEAAPWSKRGPEPSPAAQPTPKQRAEEFELRLDWLRKRADRPGDSLLLDELLNEPRTWRRHLILFLPGFPRRLVKLLTRIREMDPIQAPLRLSAEAVAYWEQVLASDRIEKRRLLVAMFHFTLAFAAVAGLSYLLTGDVFWSVAGLLAGQLFAFWLLVAGIEVLVFRWKRWRTRKADEKRKAQSHLAQDQAKSAIKPDKKAWDSYSMVTLVFTIMAALVGLMQVATGDPKSNGGLNGLLLLLIPVSLITLAGGRLRFEAIFLMIVATALGAKSLYLSSSQVTGQETAVACLAACAAVALCVVADVWHASNERISASAARKEKNFVMWMLGGALAIVFVLMPSTDSVASTLATQEPEREVARENKPCRPPFDVPALAQNRPQSTETREASTEKAPIPRGHMPLHRT